MSGVAFTLWAARRLLDEWHQTQPIGRSIKLWTDDYFINKLTKRWNSLTEIAVSEINMIGEKLGSV